MRLLGWIISLFIGTKAYKRFNGVRAIFVRPGFRRGTWGMIGAATISTVGGALLSGGGGGTTIL